MKNNDTHNSCSSTHELIEIKARITQSYKQADAILTSIPDGIILLSELGNILIFNSQAREILGIPENLHILEKPFTDFFPDTFFGFSISDALNSLSLPKTLRVTLSKNNQDYDTEIFVRRNSSNGYLFILIRDRSEYKQLENAIERYRNIAELGKMTATLAHEIRNPLSGIAGFAALLKEELTSSRHQRMLSSIIEGTRSLSTLVSSMLEYTKSQPLNLKIIDLQDFFSSLIPLLSITFPTCQYERETTIPLIRSIDPDRINSVVWNLVKNASEATELPMTLTLHASGDISVTNPGQLSPSVMDKLFTPFFTTKPRGNGLGLAEALKIMRLHGGDIHVKNSQKNVRFTLKIPCL
ncbi:Sensor histidine kinase RcsC [Chlamydia avium]|uniref:histidine kinase n=2 Tax=Chlamydia avium TaxID=1457141 RepID=W8JI10_9CHLA|nr:histidine kinase dimerization/phospho-acceptor domain-containing protein [Chlamydia avium]AHK63805.1 His Kinase A domain protein [Chlamydia avium 10DC88]EPP36562.1 his Kinase A domain protein [Chlamydia psittaci 10_743_SC13]EPP38646.1 his Kinase A domain protein [Chlamydia avium]VVT43386.1 Sensor histidine kinase RcsC [Chlamydia avium]